jgi:hypothetical protein
MYMIELCCSSDLSIMILRLCNYACLQPPPVASKVLTCCRARILPLPGAIEACSLALKALNVIPSIQALTSSSTVHSLTYSTLLTLDILPSTPNATSFLPTGIH